MQTTTKPTIQTSKTKGEKASTIFECKPTFAICKKNDNPQTALKINALKM
jgi:hypothetical protein